MFSKADIARLAYVGESVTYQPGESVMSKGDKVEAAFVVEEGMFEAGYDVNDDGQDNYQYKFERGQMFGELAIFENQPTRIFSITANSKTGGKVIKLLKEDLLLAEKNNKGLTEDAIISKAQYEDYFNERNKEKALKNCPIFKKLSKSDLTRIRFAMTLGTYEKDEIVFESGEIGDCIYFVKSGKFRRIDPKSGEILTIEETGGYFGAYSPLFGGTRKLTVYAEEDNSEVWALSRDDFFELVQDSPVFDSALLAVKEKYGLKTWQDIVKTLSYDELIGLVKTKSLPKKKSVSLHSTMSTVASGLYFAALLSMFHPGFYSNGWPRIYDQMLFDNVSLTRLTSGLFAIIGVSGVFRLPPKTPKLRRLLFEQGAWLCTLAYFAQDSNLNIGTEGGFTLDMTTIIPGVILTAVIAMTCINTMECLKESIVGPERGRESILLGGSNRWVEAFGQIGVVFGILVAIPTQFFIAQQDPNQLLSVNTPGITAASGIFLTTNLILSGFIGFSMLIATLLFEKKFGKKNNFVACMSCIVMARLK